MAAGRGQPVPGESANADLRQANLSLNEARDELQQNLYYAEMGLARRVDGFGRWAPDRVEDLLAHWHPSPGRSPIGAAGSGITCTG